MKITLIDYLVIKKSKLFDSHFYLKQYEDIRRSDIDPLKHYIYWGWKEGRNPSADFNTSVYLLDHPELVEKKINPLIHFIRYRNKRKFPEALSLRGFYRIMIKGLFFIIKLNGVVFFAGYPYPEREKDGYYQRIRSIDTLLSDRWRIYVDSISLPGRDSWFDIPGQKTLVIRPNSKGFEKISQICILMCVMRCGVVYFHSLLSIGKIINIKLFWSTPFIKRIIDLHGAVPEEFKYQGDEDNANYFKRIEGYVLRNVNFIIVVSASMQLHIKSKYPDLPIGKFITLPIFQQIDIENYDKPLVDGKPTIIYSGGIQKWQQVPKMVNAISKTINNNYYRFYCPQPEIVAGMFTQDIQKNPALIIDSKNLEEIVFEYRLSHYGFILREDNIVNHVACPTKLIEYLATGIIPIIDSEIIGDFKNLGMRSVSLDNLLKNNLPNNDKRIEMMNSNYIVYKKLINLYQTGVINLRNSVGYRTPKVANSKDNHD